LILFAAGGDAIFIIESLLEDDDDNDALVDGSVLLVFPYCCSSSGWLCLILNPLRDIAASQYLQYRNRTPELRHDGYEQTKLLPCAASFSTSNIAVFAFTKKDFRQREREREKRKSRTKRKDGKYRNQTKKMDRSLKIQKAAV
jgi:hypothetical protein